MSSRPAEVLLVRGSSDVWHTLDDAAAGERVEEDAEGVFVGSKWQPQARVEGLLHALELSEACVASHESVEELEVASALCLGQRGLKGSSRRCSFGRGSLAYRGSLEGRHLGLGGPRAAFSRCAGRGAVRHGVAVRNMQRTNTGKRRGRVAQKKKKETKKKKTRTYPLTRDDARLGSQRGLVTLTRGDAHEGTPRRGWKHADIGRTPRVACNAACNADRSCIVVDLLFIRKTARG